jgi:hypothetical protein
VFAVYRGALAADATAAFTTTTAATSASDSSSSAGIAYSAPSLRQLQVRTRYAMYTQIRHFTMQWHDTAVQMF